FPALFGVSATSGEFNAGFPLYSAFPPLLGLLKSAINFAKLKNNPPHLTDAVGILLTYSFFSYML
ncbi:hypothetical protein, partial [Cohnella sp.]|uniref:hypothetical protein n=1 Tax=Cohnella sp. TaxID=1883426 RepID=UPI0037046829